MQYQVDTFNATFSETDKKEIAIKLSGVSFVVWPYLQADCTVTSLELVKKENYNLWLSEAQSLAHGAVSAGPWGPPQRGISSTINCWCSGLLCGWI